MNDPTDISKLMRSLAYHRWANATPEQKKKQIKIMNEARLLKLKNKKNGKKN